MRSLYRVVAECGVTGQVFWFCSLEKGEARGRGPGEGDAAVSEDDTVDTMMRTEIRCT